MDTRNDLRKFNPTGPFAFNPPVCNCENSIAHAFKSVALTLPTSRVSTVTSRTFPLNRSKHPHAKLAAPLRQLQLVDQLLIDASNTLHCFFVSLHAALAAFRRLLLSQTTLSRFETAFRSSCSFFYTLESMQGACRARINATTRSLKFAWQNLHPEEVIRLELLFFRFYC